MNQQSKVANPARSQLNRKNEHFPVPMAGEFGLARRVRPSRPASTCLFSILRLNPVLIHGISPNFRVGGKNMSRIGLLLLGTGGVRLDFKGEKCFGVPSFTASSRIM